MLKIQNTKTESLSFYRTEHEFERYAEFSTLEEFQEYRNWAMKKKVDLYILGNGSNTLFGRKKVKSLVLKNTMPKEIKVISDCEVKISSSTLVIEVLRHCYKNSLDSFYYLASVPATVGGALAMNAGRGRGYNLTIYDFVEGVEFFDFHDGCTKTLGKQEVIKGYRETIFTGAQSSFLILSATFKFKELALKGNPVADRCKWSKENQDYSAPNCGSVFKEADPNILNALKGIRIGNTSFSKKTRNWILNDSKNHIPIMLLIEASKIIHFIKRKKISPEVIIVK